MTHFSGGLEGGPDAEQLVTTHPIPLPKSPEVEGESAKGKAAEMVKTAGGAEGLSSKEVSPTAAYKICNDADAYFLSSAQKSAYKDNAKAEKAMLTAIDNYEWMKPAVARYNIHANAGGIHVFDPNILATEVAEEAYREIGSHFLEEGTNGTYDNRGDDLYEYVLPPNESKAKKNALKAKKKVHRSKGCNAKRTISINHTKTKKSDSIPAYRHFFFAPQNAPKRTYHPLGKRIWIHPRTRKLPGVSLSRGRSTRNPIFPVKNRGQGLIRVRTKENPERHKNPQNLRRRTPK